ncbi:hypothetical protein EV361DRAFT_943515 [Lentinula raphanica]|nr:hypothetical protein EV361DRAFT_943515 [Lentinula raphanica]
MQSEQEFYITSCFLCAKTDDPWVKKLSDKSVTVLHASWVSRCVEKQRLVAISRFVLDEYFVPIQEDLPARPSIRYRSTYTESEVTPSPPSSPTHEENEPVLPLKRQFHQMDSPTTRTNDQYSPARTRPTKRQRVRSPSVTDSDPDTVKSLVQIIAPKPYPVLHSQLQVVQNQRQTRDQDAFFNSPSSGSSCVSSPSRACLPLPRVTFPRLDLRQMMSLNHPLPQHKNHVPLRIRLDAGAQTTISSDDPSTRAFKSFWNGVAQQNSPSGPDQPTSSSPTVYISVSSLPDMVPPPTSPLSPAIFLPGKIHRGKKFSTRKRAVVALAEDSGIQH